MLLTNSHILATLSFFFTQTSRVFAQQLSDTSGWALRGNQTCPAGESECGATAHGFVACCPASSPCLPQYNSVCCPPDTNCTDALVKAGPWCADPTWVLCNNNGFFCCLSGQTCYSDGNTDGCANPGQESVGPKQQVLQHMQQVPRSSIASTATTTSSGATSSSSSKPSQNNSGGLNTSDKIAIGIGVPVGVATILGSWASWKLYRRKKHKLGN